MMVKKYSKSFKDITEYFRNKYNSRCRVNFFITKNNLHRLFADISFIVEIKLYKDDCTHYYLSKDPFEKDKI